MAKYIEWYLKCPSCGLESSVFINVDATEEDKKTIQACPCGSERVIVKQIDVCEVTEGGKVIWLN